MKHYGCVNVEAAREISCFPNLNAVTKPFAFFSSQKKFSNLITKLN